MDLPGKNKYQYTYKSNENNPSGIIFHVIFIKVPD